MLAHRCLTGLLWHIRIRSYAGERASILTNIQSGIRNAHIAYRTQGGIGHKLKDNCQHNCQLKIDIHIPHFILFFLLSPLNFKRSIYLILSLKFRERQAN